MRPDTITVEYEEHAQVTATAATLTVTIEGSSVFLGDEAIRKAREVSTLVATLAALGVPPDQIHVTDVRVGSDGFLGLKSSSCRYTICIRDLATNQVASVVAAIASHKGADLISLQWSYSGLDAHIVELRQRCLAASRDTGLMTAASLGVKITGVYRHSEEIRRPDDSQILGSRRSNRHDKAAFAGIRAKDESGPALSFVARLSLATHTQYRVAPHDDAFDISKGKVVPPNEP